MTTCRLLSLIAWVAVAATAAAAESDAPRIRAARYYAAGLEQPLMELRRGALLLKACSRLRKSCTKEQRQLAAKSRTLTLLDELTLFPQRPGADPAAGVERAADLKERISAAGTELMRASGEYDRALIARYGAALSVCPGDRGGRFRESLEALTDVDLRQFHGLEGADFEAARKSIAAAEADATETLRKLPAEDCDAALTVGQLMMEFLTGKLEPWTREHRRVANAELTFDFNAASKPPSDDAPTRDLAVSVTGNFVTLVATELQLTVFPDTAPRIKAIADAVGH